MLGFQSFHRGFHHFVLAKLATSSIRVKSSHTNICEGQVEDLNLHVLLGIVLIVFFTLHY